MVVCCLACFAVVIATVFQLLAVCEAEMLKCTHNIQLNGNGGSVFCFFVFWLSCLDSIQFSSFSSFVLVRFSFTSSLHASVLPLAAPLHSPILWALTTFFCLFCFCIPTQNFLNLQSSNGSSSSSLFVYFFAIFSGKKIVLKELWSKSQKELHFQPSTLSKHLCSRLRSVLWGPAEQVFFHIFTSYGVSSSTIFRTIQYIFFSFVWRAENMYRGKNSGYSNGNGTFIWCHLSCARSKGTYVSVKIEMGQLWFLTAKIARI